MLGDEEEARGEDGGGSGDVEGIVRVTACADYIALRTRRGWLWSAGGGPGESGRTGWLTYESAGVAALPPSPGLDDSL